METVNTQAETMPTRTDDVKVIITKQEPLIQKDLVDTTKKNQNESLNSFEDYINPKYIHNTLRNHGYNNYQALTDILDNSFEDSVGASFVNIEITLNKKDKGEPYKSIIIVDNGSGMNLETLKEAIKLGSETGKNSDDDLGCYGVGLKSATLSMGKTLEIYTKHLDDHFYYVKYDVDDIKLYGFESIGWRKGTNEEYKIFQDKVKGETGTIIQITNIDRIKNKNLTQFESTLKRELGTTYMYFLKEMKKKIYVNGDEVYAIDPMYRDKDYVLCLSSNETMHYDDKEFKFNVYDMRLREGETNILEYARNSKHSGIWIYRNLRLVGKALDLEILKNQGDNHGVGVRIELHMSGDADYLFGSTTTKIITEKSSEYIDQGFHNKLSDKLKPYVTQIRREQQTRSKKQEDTSEIKKELDGIYDKINGNKLLNLPKWGENKKHLICEKCGKLKTQCDCPKKDKPIPPSNREIKPRERKEKNIKYDIQPLGKMDDFIKFDRDNGRIKIVYNSEHASWDKFRELDNFAKAYVTEIFVSMAYGMERSGYYHEDRKDAQKTFNFFMEMMSEGLRINIAYN